MFEMDIVLSSTKQHQRKQVKQQEAERNCEEERQKGSEGERDNRSISCKQHFDHRQPCAVVGQASITAILTPQDTGHSGRLREPERENYTCY